MEDEEDEAPDALEQVVVKKSPKTNLGAKSNTPKPNPTGSNQKKSSTNEADKTSTPKTKAKPTPTKTKSETVTTKDNKKEKKEAVPSEGSAKKPIKISKTPKVVEAKVSPDANLGSRRQPPAKNDTGKFQIRKLLHWNQTIRSANIYLIYGDRFLHIRHFFVLR